MPRESPAHQALVVLPVDADPTALDDDVCDLPEIAETDPFWLAPLHRPRRPLGLQLFVSALSPKISTMGEALDALRRGRRKGIGFRPFPSLGNGTAGLRWLLGKLGYTGRELGVPRELEEKLRSMG